MKRCLFALVLLLSLATGLQAQTCDKQAVISVAAGTTGVIVTSLEVSRPIYVCGFVLTADTIATTAQFQTGTGTTCATNSVNLTGAMRLCDECNIVFGNGVGYVLTTTKGADLCLAVVTGAVTGVLTYRDR